MKTILLTGYDERMRPIGELTAPRMLDYANRHGMDFHCTRQFNDLVTAYWQKVDDVLRSFRNGYERVIWLDADQVITNFDFVPPGERGFHASLDWGVDAADGDLSMCGFTVGKSGRYLFEWIDSHKAEFVDKPFPEQTPMRQLYRDEQWAKAVMVIHPRRTFNAVPAQIHESVVDPWQPGDWCAHLTMVEVPLRRELFPLFAQ